MMLDAKVVEIEDELAIVAGAAAERHFAGQ